MKIHAVLLSFYLFTSGCTCTKHRVLQKLEPEFVVTGTYKKTIQEFKETHWAIRDKQLNVTGDWRNFIWNPTNDPIELKEGLSFGFVYQFKVDEKLKYIEYTREISHPKMILPDGTSSTGYEWNIGHYPENGLVEELIGYTITEPFAMVAGDWSFTIKYEGQTLFHKVFKITNENKSAHTMSSSVASGPVPASAPR